MHVCNTMDLKIGTKAMISKNPEKCKKQLKVTFENIDAVIHQVKNDFLV